MSNNTGFFLLLLHLFFFSPVSCFQFLTNGRLVSAAQYAGHTGYVPDVNTDLKCYVQRYLNLFKEFCNGEWNLCRWDEIYRHYQIHGSKEGLLFECIRNQRDLVCYAKRHLDLYENYCDCDDTKCDYEGLQLHFYQTGAHQGLLFGCVDHSEDLKCYAERYPNLRKEFCHEGHLEHCDYDQLYLHWLNHGFEENLIFHCVEIDAKLAEHLKCYGERYDDLYEVWCPGDECQLEKLYQHWNETGSANSLVFGCLDVEHLTEDINCYGERYISLFDSYCDGDDECDVDGLWIHWNQYGLHENLRFGCNSDLRNEPDVSLNNYIEATHTAVELLTLVTGMSSKTLTMLSSLVPRLERDDRMQLRILGLGMDWLGWQWRAQQYWEAIKTSTAEYLLICDTDIFVNSNLNSENLISKYQRLMEGQDEDKVVVSVEKLCCTMDMSVDSEAEMISEMKEREATLFELLSGKFGKGDIFPNFGLLMGTKAALIELFPKLLGLMDDFSDDQTVLQQYYLEYPDVVVLDHNQVIFGTTDGRVEEEELRCTMYGCEVPEEGENYLFRHAMESKGIPQEIPMFFHGPGDDLECMEELKQCVENSFVNRDTIVGYMNHLNLDCLSIEYEKPSWQSSGHRMKKKSTKFADFDSFKCEPTERQIETEKLMTAGFSMLPAQEGYCRTTVNAHLPTGLKRNKELNECLQICEKEGMCVGFSYNSALQLCEFQCTYRSDLCPEPEFPPGNVGGKCLTLAEKEDHADKQVESHETRCYRKEHFCVDHRRRLSDQRDSSSFSLSIFFLVTVLCLATF